jgi:hypothetical protein
MNYFFEHGRPDVVIFINDGDDYDNNNKVECIM